VRVSRHCVATLCRVSRDLCAPFAPLGGRAAMILNRSTGGK
jgi:hypothetical protein